MPKDALTDDEVRHVAKLARLALTDVEAGMFARQLGVILNHAADVAALDIADVPATAHPLPLSNVFRNDVVRAGLDREEVLQEAPDSDADRFRVPTILGNG